MNTKAKYDTRNIDQKAFETILKFFLSVGIIEKFHSVKNNIIDSDKNINNNS